MDSRVGITTPPLNRTAMRHNEDLLKNLFFESPQLVLRKSTTCSSEVHNLFLGSPQLVLGKSTTCSAEVHIWFRPQLVVDCCQLGRRRPDAVSPSQSKGSRGLSGKPAGCPIHACVAGASPSAHPLCLSDCSFLSFVLLLLPLLLQVFRLLVTPSSRHLCPT